GKRELAGPGVVAQRLLKEIAAGVVVASNVKEPRRSAVAQERHGGAVGILAQIGQLSDGGAGPVVGVGVADVVGPTAVLAPGNPDPAGAGQIRACQLDRAVKGTDAAG